MNLKTELLALKRCFHFHPGNSNPQKIALWVAMGLFTVAALGSFFGAVDLETPTNRVIFEALLGVMAFLWGRTQGKEVAFAKSQ